MTSYTNDQLEQKARAAERKLMIDQHEAFIMAEMSFRQSAAFATREGLSPTVWDQHADSNAGARAGRRPKALSLAEGRARRAPGNAGGRSQPRPA